MRTKKRGLCSSVWVSLQRTMADVARIGGTPNAWWALEDAVSEAQRQMRTLTMLLLKPKREKMLNFKLKTIQTHAYHRYQDSLTKTTLKPSSATNA